MMTSEEVLAAAEAIWTHWRGGAVMDALPEALRPRSLADGYRIQARLPEVAGQAVIGWKIAATALAGQRHLAVDAPIAGRLLAERTWPAPATLDVGRNRFRVAEAEFAFVLRRALPARDAPYERAEVMDAVATLHPAIELPDTRFTDVTLAGAAQIAADNASADLFVLGPAAPDAWRELDLASHPVRLDIDGETATRGTGADVLGDPRDALTWLANQHALLGEGLAAGQTVTTGVCGQPAPYETGQALHADFGTLGSLTVNLRG